MRAVIYCRVSTKEQVANLSLTSQRRVCEEYCRREGWQVDTVFTEQGESAKTADRTELTAMLAYCRQHKKQIDVLLVYRMDRLSRNATDALHLIRTFLASLGIAVRSATEAIEDGPMGRFMQTLLAGLAELDNDIRAERTVTGMREALRQGRWTWRAPLGYLNVKAADGSKTIAPDPDRADLIRRGFDLYASGLHSKEEVLIRLADAGLETRRGKKVSRQTWGKVLENPIYMGRIRVDRWDIDTEGDFDAIVPEHTFYRVQTVLRDSENKGKRVRNNPDFPLRRFARCSCGGTFTGCWTQGNGGRYPYYRCRGCKRYLKRDILHGLFLDLLRSLAPDPAHLAVLHELVTEEWAKLHDEAESTRSRLGRQLTELDGRKSRLTEAFVYEKALDKETYNDELDKLREQMAATEIRLSEARVEELDVEAALSFAEYLVSDAAAIWSHAESVEQRREIQRLLLPEGIILDGEQILTPATCSFFSYLEPNRANEARMVTPTGFEPVLPA